MFRCISITGALGDVFFSVFSGTITFYPSFSGIAFIDKSPEPFPDRPLPSFSLVLK